MFSDGKELQLMVKKFKEFWPDFFLPTSLIFNNLILFFLFYIGLCYIENPARDLFFILLCILFACLSGLTFLKIIKDVVKSKQSTFWLLAVIAFYFIEFGMSIFRHGLDANIIQYLQKFIVFSIPAFFAGIYAGIKKTENVFFVVLEKISLFMLPAALIYFNGCLFNCSGFTKNRGLGIFNYMSVAYSFMPFLLAHIYQLINGAKFFIFKEKKHQFLFRSAVIFIYWIDIIATGTRGCYVCVIAFCLMFIAMKLLRRERVRSVLLITILLVGILLFNLFIYCPPGMSGVKRLNIVLDGIKNGELITSNMEDENAEDYFDYFVSQNGDEQIANVSDEAKDTLEFPSESIDTQKVPDKSIIISNRMSLYKLAIKEFEKEPIIGMGAGRYTLKYGLYPHNAILELLCETGIIATTFFLGLLLLVLIKLTKLSKYDEDICGLLMFFLAYAVQANISGSIWNCPVLLCALGYGLSLCSSTLPSREDIQIDA